MSVNNLNKCLIILCFYVSIYFVMNEPKWWNWQTRWTQNPVGLKPRAGSTPAFGTSEINGCRVSQILELNIKPALVMQF